MPPVKRRKKHLRRPRSEPNTPYTTDRFSPVTEPLEFQHNAPTREALQEMRQTALQRDFTPDDSAARVRLAVILGLHLQGKKVPEIAKLTGLRQPQVRHGLRVLREMELLANGVESAMLRFQSEAVPLAMDGFITQLNKGNKDFIIRTLEATNILQSRHQSFLPAAPTVAAAPSMPTLTLNLNLPPGTSGTPTTMGGQVLSNPRTITVPRGRPALGPAATMELELPTAPAPVADLPAPVGDAEATEQA